MSPEYWQIIFSVKGLRAPDEILLNDDILIKGSPHDDAYVFLRFSSEEDEEKDRITDNMIVEMNNVLHLYGLITNMYAQLHSGRVTTKITSETPFGYTKYRPGSLVLIPTPTDEQRNDHVPSLRKTVEKYNFIKKITIAKHKRYLLNAIEYYHRSLGEYTNEVKLIDLMICLESLFSRENQELRLRYSLRMSYLLCVNEQEKFSEIYRMVYDLYLKRSKVVHGSESVELNDKDIWTFRNYLKEAIKIFIHVEISKEELLKLLDDSVYDPSIREKLVKIVSDAMSKW